LQGLEQTHPAEAGASIAGENQMIEDGAVDRFRRRGQAPGGAAVRVAGRGVSAGVIVGKHDARAPVQRRVCDYRSQREIGARVVTLMLGDMKALRLVVDMSDLQALPSRIGVGHASGEERSSGVQSGKLQCEFGTLIAHRGKVWPRRSWRHRNRVQSGTNPPKRMRGAAPIGRFGRSG
jgi:hypothetical protein